MRVKYLKALLEWFDEDAIVVIQSKNGDTYREISMGIVRDTAEGIEYYPELQEKDKADQALMEKLGKRKKKKAKKLVELI